MTQYDEKDLTLQTFSQKVNQLARSNRFVVTILGGSFNGDNVKADLKFFISKATIPQVSIAGPEMNYFGTKMMFAGDPKFEPLTITLLNTGNWSVREYFEDWASTLTDYSYRENKHSPVQSVRLGSTVVVSQLGLKNDTIAEYEYYNAVPLTITSIDLDQSTADTTETFDVTFQYTYYKRVV